MPEITQWVWGSGTQAGPGEPAPRARTAGGRAIRVPGLR